MTMMRWRRSVEPFGKGGMRGLAHVVLLLTLALAQPARAATPADDDPSRICDRVTAVAAQRTGVPLSVLKAITLTETGRKRGGTFRPWPWTVNMEGAGTWFDSRAEALAYVYDHHDAGARSFDVGCFQINYKWHHANFASIEEMFDPLQNALYAARLLADLHAEMGSWTEAAGAYHSRTPKHADRYKAIFARHRESLRALDALPVEVAAAADLALPLAPTPTALARSSAPARVNAFPLLQAGQGTGQLGSLVPLTASAGTSLFARPSDG